MVRRAVLADENIRFNEAVRHSEDMLFVSDLRLVGRLRLADQPLTAKRIHAQQQSGDPWHTIWSMRNRVAWVRSHAEQIGPDFAKQVEAEFRDAMIGAIENSFWKRQLDGLEKARATVIETFPDATHEILTRPIRSKWIYKLRDLFG